MNKASWFIVLGALTLIIAGTIPAVGGLFAQAAPPSVFSQTNPPPSPGISNDTCLACHSNPDQYYNMPNGDEIYLTVDDSAFEHSIHGQSGIACVQCHTDITGYPHPATSAQSARELTIELNQACVRCHQSEADKTINSTHQKALDEGNQNAAVCTDCHSAHEVQSIPVSAPERKQFAAQTCERCHSAIFDEYAHSSVHGIALFDKNNADVPTCIDCHGSHSIAGPTTNEYFAMYSPQLCQECHADKKLMAKYNLTASTFETYVADFHGTSVELFEPRYPGQQSNKPVCIDCHGVHNILAPNNPNSTVFKDNLLSTCQKCHPDATTNFPTAWLGHYTPDLQQYPLYYFVDIFYKIFIPAVLGVLAFFVLIDIYRRFIRRPKENKNA